MNRKAEKFFDAVTHLREDLVEEAQNYVFRRKRSGWKTVGSLAACMALVVSLGMLAVLPRGCGASAPGSSGSDMNNSSAPMERPPASTDTAAPPAGDGKPDLGLGDGQVQFTAQVLEVLEDELLVEPFDAPLADMGPVRVPLDGLEGLPEFYPGAVVQVLCGAVSGGAAEAVAEIRLLEPEGP